MASIRQTHFGAGELSPLLWGRTDLRLYGAGLRVMRNFFPSKQSMAVSRPGTQLVRATKFTTGPHSPVRLVPWVINGTSSYVLEFGEYYIRFHQAGATVLSGGVPLELVTSFTSDEVASITFAQVGDVMTVCHANHRPAELKHLADGSWTFLDTVFAPPEPYQLNLAGDTRLLRPRLFQPTGADNPFTDDSTHRAREWQWRVSMTIQKSDGSRAETTSVLVTNITEGLVTDPAGQEIGSRNITLYEDRPVKVLIDTGSGDVGAASRAQGRVLAYNVYRGRGELFGFVGSTTTFEFVDVGDAPNYAIQPLLGEDPRAVTALDGTTTYDTFSAVAFAQERRILAGSALRPAWLFCSATGNYGDFDAHKVPLASQALVFELASRRREYIRNIIGLKNRLFVFTDSSVWLVGGSQGDPLTPDNIQAQVESEIGANRLLPLVINDAVLHVSARGRSVRALVTDTNDGFPQGVRGEDISEHAAHLFFGGETPVDGVVVTKDIVDWCYAHEPWGLVWAVRADGVLLSLTRSSEMWGWARHDTTGRVIACCAVPEANEDAVYLVVQRANGQYLERMASRVRNDTVEDDAALDCALRYQGAPTQTLTGLWHLEGQEVWCVAKGSPPMGPMTVSAGTVTLPELPAVNNVSLIDGDQVVLFVGLPFTPELETLGVVTTDSRAKQKQVLAVTWEVDQSRGLWAGQDFDHLTEWRQRRVTDGYLPPANSTEVFTMPVNGNWDKHARAVLRQTLPLPVTVVGLTREVDVGG